MAETLQLRTIEDVETDILHSAPAGTRECRAHNWVSSLGDICERRLVYWRIMGDMALDTPAGLRGIFGTGNLLAPIVIEQILNPFGRRQSPTWEILGRETKPRDALFTKLAISGRVDGIRHVADATGRMQPYNVVELKSMNPNIFAGIHGIDDLGKWHWAAKYPDQLLLYMLGYEMVERPGWLILFNKANLYEMRIIEVPFDESRADVLLRRAERINTHIDADSLPRQIRRPDICEHCPFLPHCAPRLQGDPDDAPEIYKPTEHPELADLLQRYVDLEQASREAGRVNRALTARLVKGQTVICGDIVVRWETRGKKWSKKIRRVGDGKPEKATEARQ